MDDFRFDVLYHNISNTVGQWIGGNERLYAMELRFQLKRFPPRAGLKHKTTRSAGQRLTQWAIGTPV